MGEIDEKAEEEIHHFEECIAVEQYECLELLLTSNHYSTAFQVSFNGTVVQSSLVHFEFVKFGNCSSMCDENQSELVMKLVTDAHPNDFLWSLNHANGETIFSAGFKYMQSYGLYHHYDCVTVEPNMCLTLMLYDVWGDVIFKCVLVFLHGEM